GGQAHRDRRPLHRGQGSDRRLLADSGQVEGRGGRVGVAMSGRGRQRDRGSSGLRDVGLPARDSEGCAALGRIPMLYAILCYDSEAVVGSWTKEQDDLAMSKLAVVQEKLAKEGRLGPVARLMPTTKARTLRKGRESVVLDGPFAETKEQLLGF